MEQSFLIDLQANANAVKDHSRGTKMQFQIWEKVRLVYNLMKNSSKAERLQCLKQLDNRH